MKLSDTFFGSWTIDRRIGSGSYGSVYRLKKTEAGEIYYSAMKIIPVGGDASENILKELTNEISLMSRLKGNSNIVSCEDHEIIKHGDGGGYDILIRMEYLEPILKYEKRHGFTENDVIKLALDMCRALELCENNNIIHRDIKPENIFISPNGDFKLGDFGIARTIEKSAEMSLKGTFAYIAPEVYRGENYGFPADIYSLGIVLYRFMNGGLLPFVRDASAASASERENAVKRRLGGEKLPDIGGGSIMKIILKACAYKPSDRYQTAREMKDDIALFIENSRKEEKTGVFDKLAASNRLITALKILAASLAAADIAILASIIF